MNDKAEKMGMVNVALSMPALLAFIFQVGNPSVLVEGRPAITFVQNDMEFCCNVGETLYLSFALLCYTNALPNPDNSNLAILNSP